MKMKTATLTIAATALSLTACSQAFRPQVTSLDGGLGTSTKPAITTPVAIPEPPAPAMGALWVPGSKQFFKDSRARTVGDIVTVVVAETASAQTQAKTSTARSHTQQAGILNLPWVKGMLGERGIPLGVNDLANTNSNRSFSGNGKTDRSDSLNASIAAVVTQVLPNGLLVIQGQREVLVNYEKQVMTLQGMIRPEDISAGNTIASSKIAEARIAYSGSGNVDESQTTQYGARALDKVLPF